jgi:hypothetical protein
VQTIKISTIAKTAIFAVVAGAVALGLAGPADAAAGTTYGNPVAAAKWWRHQKYDDCILMASADLIGQMTGKEPSEQAIIKRPNRPPASSTLARSTPSRLTPRTRIRLWALALRISRRCWLNTTSTL